MSKKRSGPARGAAPGGREGAKARARKGRPPADEKEVVVSFRAERHLAEALTRLPDRSVFIRRAILRAFYPVCPACQGKGVLPEPTARAIQGFMERTLPLQCRCCGFAYPAAGERKRGAYVCADCTEHEQEHGHPPGMRT